MIQLDKKFIDKNSCENAASAINDLHLMPSYHKDIKNLSSEEESIIMVYPDNWKAKCIPASEWPF